MPDDSLPQEFGEVRGKAQTEAWISRQAAAFSAASGIALTPAGAVRDGRLKGKKLAASPWGAVWNRHLQEFELHFGRLAEGRRILRYGGLFNVTVEPNRLSALVFSDRCHQCLVALPPISDEGVAELRKVCWESLEDAGRLIAGDLSPGLMQRVAASHGLLPQPGEIRPRCDCTDDADLCGHAAALLYGFGRHIDAKPEDFFRLRGIDPTAQAREQYQHRLAEDAAGDAEDGWQDLFDVRLS